MESKKLKDLIDLDRRFQIVLDLSRYPENVKVFHTKYDNSGNSFLRNEESWTISSGPFDTSGSGVSFAKAIERWLSDYTVFPNKLIDDTYENIPEKNHLETKMNSCDIIVRAEKLTTEELSLVKIKPLN